MSRTIGGSLATHLAGRGGYLSRGVRLDLFDGAVIAAIGHNRDLTVNLGDGAQLYSSSTGIRPGAITLTEGLTADSCEIRGPISDTITRAMVLGGRFRGARARIFDVRWNAPTQFMRLLAGKVYGASVEANAFVLEVRSAAAAFNQTIGHTLSPYCDAEFGDARCGGTPLTWAATVAAVTDDLTLELAWTGDTPTADQARAGRLTFTDGGLFGTMTNEVFALAGDVVTLYQPLPDLPQVGDGVLVKEGCAKTLPVCVEKQGDAINFRGFDSLIGNDYLKYPAPK